MALTDLGGEELTQAEAAEGEEEGLEEVGRSVGDRSASACALASWIGVSINSRGGGVARKQKAGDRWVDAHQTARTKRARMRARKSSKGTVVVAVAQDA